MLFPVFFLLTVVRFKNPMTDGPVMWCCRCFHWLASSWFGRLAHDLDASCADIPIFV
jgi:hypothetical protein